MHTEKLKIKIDFSFENEGSGKIVRTKDWVYLVQISLYCFTSSENIPSCLHIQGPESYNVLPAWNHVGETRSE